MASGDVAEIVRALDFAKNEEWQDAVKALDGIEGPIADRLRSVFLRMLERARARADAFSSTRHELANAMAIALANLEGMVDGAVAASPTRLHNVCEALRGARGLLEGLRGYEPDRTKE